MAADISVALITVDTVIRRAYLATTLANLDRGGLQTSPRLAHFRIVSHQPGERTATDNVRLALHLASTDAVPWVLFLEDDIDVIDGFLDAVGLWLDRHASQMRRVYSFSCPHPAVLQVEGEVFNYPIKYFCCTQAFAIRHDDAVSLSQWFQDHPTFTGPDGNTSTGAYDLSMREWARTRYPLFNHFSAAVPNFVEHTGQISATTPGRPNEIRMPGWPGREWRYR